MQVERITTNPGPQTKAFASSADITVYGGAAGGGKRLRVDEPIPTPTGWSTMGELRPGDIVIGADGKAATVLWCSEVEHNPDAWELEFDDGTTIECDADHQWVTLSDDERQRLLRVDADWRAKRRAARPSRATGKRSAAFVESITRRNAQRTSVTTSVPAARGSVRTTREIIDTLRVGKSQRANHCVLNPDPIELQEADLLVDPYTLGAWLGDGTSKSGELTGDDAEVWQAIEAAGYVVTHSATVASRHHVRGLKVQLRALGVLENKHVPLSYLRGSVAQRTALLQGLCDTDGHATASGGVEFTTTAVALRDGVVELLASLGIKPSVREGRATLNGRDISAKWRIKFYTAVPCFRIARKLERQKRDSFRGVHDRRYIVGARKVPPTPMRCIAVDNESRTYLAGRRMVVTHNTHLALLRFAVHAAENPGYFGVIFRREMPMITVGGGLWEESMKLFPVFGARPNLSTREWRFPNRSLIQFRSLQHESDMLNYQGAQLAEYCFEEGTHFSESMFFYLFSRLRSKCWKNSTTSRALITLNPDPDSWLRKLVDWYIGSNGLPIEERAGVKRYFVRDGDEFIWGSSKQEVRDLAPHVTADPHNQPKSLRFIPARLRDNPRGDPTYESRLNALSKVDRERLLGGNWNIRAAAGTVFKREWFKILDRLPPDVVATARGWDLAATEPSPTAKDPDWTRGVKMSRHQSGLFVVQDMVSLRARPHAVDKLVKDTTHADGRGVRQALWQDPGAAGKSDAQRYVRELAGYDVRVKTASSDKLTYAKPVSAQAEGGNIALLRGPWNEEFLREMEGFPDADHDDVPDGTSRSFLDLTESVTPKHFVMPGY